MADNTHETKIVISGDDSGAVSALTRVKTALSGGILGALNGVRTAITGVMRSLGAIGLVMHGIQLAVEGFKKLNEWMNRAAKEAAQMRIDAVFKGAADAMDRLISKQGVYNKLLKEELADLARRKELQGISESAKEERENEKREIARAKEIAGAANEDEERTIRQRWAVEDEERARAKKDAGLKQSAAEEDEKAAIYGSKANAADANVKAAEKEIAAIRANFVRMNEEQIKEAKKQIEALEAKRKAAADAENFRAEERQAEDKAELYRQEREANRTVGSVAQAKNDAENAKIARERAEKEFEEKQKKARESSDAAAEFVRGYEEEKKKEAEDRAADYYGGLAEQIDQSRPQNRLTAMGLGSGASVDRTAQEQASNVKTLVQLLKEQVELTRKADGGSAATYAP